jgi:hypothetical protein
VIGRADGKSVDSVALETPETKIGAWNKEWFGLGASN